jgi:hypothetical protein
MSSENLQATLHSAERYAIIGKRGAQPHYHVIEPRECLVPTCEFEGLVPFQQVTNSPHYQKEERN